VQEGSNLKSASVVETEYVFALVHVTSWGTAVAQWLRCSATNRKVAGSLPGDIIGIFH